MFFPTDYPRIWCPIAAVSLQATAMAGLTLIGYAAMGNPLETSRRVGPKVFFFGGVVGGWGGCFFLFWGERTTKRGDHGSIFFGSDL